MIEETKIIVRVEGLDHANTRLKELAAKFPEKADWLIEDSGEKIFGDSQREVPVDTGMLKRSGVHAHERMKSTVSYNTDYACVFDAQTSVNCGKKGMKTIGRVKVGDMVLAQDGTMHKVIATNKFYAVKKPELVELEIEYRDKRKHKLILTIDHKVLTQKNNCNFWINAGELKEGDLVFSPRKTAWNEGTTEMAERHCCICGKLFSFIKSTERKVCSEKCRIMAGTKWKTGRKRSKETIEHMRISRTNFYKIFPEKHPNRVLARKGFTTAPEKAVAYWLISLGIPFEYQKNIGNLFVDFYLSDGVVIEADGAFWHSNQEKDLMRDKKLLKSSFVKKIIHLHFTDKRNSKNINPEPLPNVFYMQCNPSMDSFVNLEVFKTVKILKIRKFKYQIKTQKDGRHNILGGRLYDLSVDGIHSFVAAGLLVSNSAVHDGTSRTGPRPYLRGPAEREIPNIKKKAEKLLEG